MCWSRVRCTGWMTRGGGGLYLMLCVTGPWLARILGENSNGTISQGDKHLAGFYAFLLIWLIDLGLEQYASSSLFVGHYWETGYALSAAPTSLSADPLVPQLLAGIASNMEHLKKVNQRLSKSTYFKTSRWRDFGLRAHRTELQLLPHHTAYAMLSLNWLFSARC